MSSVEVNGAVEAQWLAGTLGVMHNGRAGKTAIGPRTSGPHRVLGREPC